MANESQANGSKLIGLDGRRIEKEPLRIPVVGWKGRQYPVRILDQQTLFSNEPRAVIAGLVTQNADQFQIVMIALTALARDLYSRQPEGSREFEEFAHSIGLTLHDVERKPITVESLLKGEPPSAEERSSGTPPAEPPPAA